MRFEGILPALTTPFAAAGDVDLDALAANVAALLDAGGAPRPPRLELTEDERAALDAALAALRVPA